MYESKKQKLAPPQVYYRRLARNALSGILILIIFLAIGTIGYKNTIPEFGWYDSFLNASMILSGMGPMINPSIILTNQAKLFAALYAIASGIAFISTFALLIAPIVHRFFHKLHLEDSSTD